MLHEKEHYKKLNYSGFIWSYFDSYKDVHVFSRKEEKGWSVIQCKEEMLTNGDMEYMAKNGLTFNPKNKINTK